MFLLKRKKNLNIYILKKTFIQTFDTDCNYQYVRYYFMIYVFRQRYTVNRIKHNILNT